jgi:hypothetical protein
VKTDSDKIIFSAYPLVRRLIRGSHLFVRSTSCDQEPQQLYT